MTDWYEIANACMCLPGKEEDGWQEVRCTACLKAESDAFRQAAENWRQWYESRMRE